MLRFTPLLALLALAAPVAAQSSPEPVPSEASGVDSLATPAPSVLPDPTVEALASLLLGTGDDPSLVGLRYRGTDEIQFVVDGLRAGRIEGLPLAGLQSLAVRSGYVPAGLGNAMGAFVEVDTREAPRQRLGRAEGLGGLDGYGYGRASLALGTETGGIRAYASGEIERADDLDPRAYATPALPADELAALHASPQVVRVDRAGADAIGFSTDGVRYETADTYYIPLPGDLPAGASVADLASAIGLSDPSLLSPTPISSLSLRSGEVPLAEVAPGSGGERLRGHAALEASPLNGLRLRLSGQGFREEGNAFSTFLAFAAPEAIPVTRDEQLRGLFEADYAVGESVVSLAGSVETASRLQYDGRFSDGIEDVIRYGDIDDPANAAARAYLFYDASSGQYVRLFEDGAINPASPYLTFASPGITSLGYSREEATTTRLLASARQRLGRVDLRLGVEAEQSTLRGVTVSGGFARGLARSIDDGSVERPIQGGNGAFGGVDSYEGFPYRSGGFDNPTAILVYGYDFRGLETADESTDPESFTTVSDLSPTFAPRKPSLLAGFAEGEWTEGGLTVRAGARLARFSSNARALYDPYALVDVYRAEDLASGSIVDPQTGQQIAQPSGGIPSTVPGDAALYVSGGQVVGYRDRDGAFYDASGASAEAQDVLFVGSPVVPLGQTGLTEAVLQNAPATIRVLPRAEAVLRAGPRTSVSVFYNAFARQPDPALAFPTLVQLVAGRSGGVLPNGALRPERLSELGATIRQRLTLAGGLRGEVGATAFYRLYRDRIRTETLAFSFPSGYTTVTNSSAANVPGLTARGSVTGARVAAMGSVTVLNEPFDLAESPFGDRPTTEDFLRVDAVAALAVSLGPGDGPAVGAFRPLAGVRVGGALRYTSGDPYQVSTQEGVPLGSPSILTGPPLRTPARLRLDLRVARGFRIGPGLLEASVAVENVLGRVNVLRVYPATGLPDDDGYLATNPSQIDGLGTAIEREAYRSLYAARVQDPLNVGRPRQIRFALRLDV